MQCPKCEKYGECPLEIVEKINLIATKFGLICPEYVEHKDQSEDDYIRR